MQAIDGLQLVRPDLFKKPKSRSSNPGAKNARDMRA